MLCGLAGAGKTHLANVWRLRSGATPVVPADLSMLLHTRPLPFKAAVLEDIDRANFDEQALFHFLNLSREEGFSVLLTARTPPARMTVALPDLASRLRSFPVSTIGTADDALLRAVLVKQFADRQLAVEPQVIGYLARRMERSMAALGPLVAAIDREALGRGRNITRPFAAQVLDALGAPQDRAGED
ncbi:MAG: DnaA/Hda family protein [Pseudomonadota bacterium]|nr:DnaA/Hda family protein [Pseudomonadota bacterium]